MMVSLAFLLGKYSLFPVNICGFSCLGVSRYGL